MVKSISEPVRAGILEHGKVNRLVDRGVSARVLRDGDIDIRRTVLTQGGGSVTGVGALR